MNHLALGPESPVLEHQLGIGDSGDPGEPSGLHVGVGHTGIANGNFAPQPQGELRAKAGRQPQRVFGRVTAALGQVQVAQLRIGLQKIGDRRGAPVLQRLDGNGVFDARAHGVAGKALGVRDDHLIGAGPKGRAQGRNLGSGGATTGRGICLVRHEQRLSAHLLWCDALELRTLSHQGGHLLRNVVQVQAGPVESRVRRAGVDQLRDRHNATTAGSVLGLNDQPDCAHTQDHAVAAGIKGQGSVLDLVLGRGCAGCQETASHPLQELGTGHVVGSDHNHALAASQANPVLGQAHGLGGARAGGVDLGIGAAGTHELGKLAVAHCQDLEEKASVKVTIGVQPLACELLGHQVVPRECRREDHAGLVPQWLGQRPTSGHLLSCGGLVVGANQGDLRVAQGLQARDDGELGGAVKGHAQALGDAVLADIEVLRLSCQSDDLVVSLDRQEAALASGVLDHAYDVLVQEALAVLGGHRGDAIVTA